MSMDNSHHYNISWHVYIFCFNYVFVYYDYKRIRQIQNITVTRAVSVLLALLLDFFVASRWNVLDTELSSIGHQQTVVSILWCCPSDTVTTQTWVLYTWLLFYSCASLRVVESTTGYIFTPFVGYFISPGIGRRDRRLLMSPPSAISF